MKIEINLRIILILILSLILKNINTYIIFIIFILIHELAHLIFGISIGGKPRSIILEPFGVSLEFFSYGKKSHLLRAIFYLIGPTINIIIAILFIKIRIFDNIINEKIILINLLIFIFNMLPILPLDGGKALKEILYCVFPSKNTNNLILIISKLFLITISFTYSIAIIKVKNIYIVFLIIYLWYL